MVVTAICMVYILIVLFRSAGDPLALVTLGTRFSQGLTDGTEGYDGQFVYYIARDPSAAAQYLDVPAYRFQRILLPILGRFLALGQQSLLPWTFLLINLVSLAVGTGLLERLLEAQRVSRWYAMTYGLTIGILGSVRLSLSEPLAYALVIAGIWLVNHDRWQWSVVVFALAALAKETTLFFVGGYVLCLLLERHWLKALWFGAASTIPFALWQIVLYTHLGTWGIGSGGAMATGFEAVPFAGIARILTETAPEIRARIVIVFGAILIPFVIVPTVWALWCTWKDGRKQSWTAYTSLLFANAIILPFVPFSTYREPIGILRFIVGLQIALILYAAEHHQRRALRYTYLWQITVFFALSLL
jgi:hypothetical protein